MSSVVEHKTKTVVRLSEEQYKQIEKRLGRVSVGRETTLVEVSYHLGIQEALRVIREEVVIRGSD